MPSRPRRPLGAPKAQTDRGLATGKVRHIHGQIRNAVADAEREGLVHRNVTKLVRPPVLLRPEGRPSRSSCHTNARRRLRRSDVVGPVGLEPTTSGLKVRCSTN